MSQQGEAVLWLWLGLHTAHAAPLPHCPASFCLQRQDKESFYKQRLFGYPLAADLSQAHGQSTAYLCTVQWIYLNLPKCIQGIPVPLNGALSLFLRHCHLYWHLFVRLIPHRPPLPCLYILQRRKLPCFARFQSSLNNCTAAAGY